MSAVFLVMGLRFIVLAMVLALALWILGSGDSQFEEYGVGNTWLRCFVLMGAVLGLGFVVFLNRDEHHDGIWSSARIVGAHRSV